MDEAKIEVFRGKTVVRFLEKGLDYIEHEGRVYSINGGYFLEPRTNDWVRWEVREPTLERAQALAYPTGTTAADVAAWDYFKGTTAVPAAEPVEPDRSAILTRLDRLVSSLAFIDGPYSEGLLAARNARRDVTKLLDRMAIE